MNLNDEIKTDRLLLRRYKLSDADDVRRIAGDFEIVDTTCSIPYPYEEGMAEEWINSHKDKKDTEIVFAITNETDGQLIGSIELSRKIADNKAEIGYFIGKDFWGKGYASEAVKALVDFGFEKCELNKITAWVFIRNPKSSRILENSGFTYEGCHKEHIYVREKYEDLKSYGFLKSEWLAKTNN